MPHRFTQRRYKSIILPLLAFSLSACASVKLPKIDLPDFRSEAENLGEFPDISEAPALPAEIRTKEAWDSTASDIIRKRDTFNAPVAPAGPKTDAEILDEIDRLTDKVNAYKADDPPVL